MDMLDLWWKVEDGYISFTEEYHFQQFTGLSDKNGKEIYEGDIVNAVHEVYDGRFTTHYRKEKYTGEITYHHSYWAIGTYKLFIMDDDSLEVIGNIYENPELLIKH